jgi:hypothetical protein
MYVDTFVLHVGTLKGLLKFFYGEKYYAVAIRGLANAEEHKTERKGLSTFVKKLIKHSDSDLPQGMGGKKDSDCTRGLAVFLKILLLKTKEYLHLSSQVGELLYFLKLTLQLAYLFVYLFIFIYLFIHVTITLICLALADWLLCLSSSSSS